MYFSHSLKTTAVVAASVVVCALAADPTSVVDLGYASYEGTLNTSTNVTNFLGIRYASPPLVDDR
jgi:hypothetical protein